MLELTVLVVVDVVVLVVVVFDEAVGAKVVEFCARET